MFRRGKAFLALLAVAGLVASACSGASKAPAISDPNEILGRSIANLAQTRSVHLDGTIEGKVSMALLAGDSGLGGYVNLVNSTLEGDVDIARQAFDLKLSVPGLFGTKVELIAVDKYLYMKNSLQSDKFTKTPLDDFPVSMPSAAASPSAIASQIADLKKQLQDAGARATLEGTDQVDGKDAYHLSITVPVDKVNEALNQAGGTRSPIQVGSATIEYWVYTDTVLPAKLHVVGDAGTSGNLDITATFGNYDAEVKIVAPDPSQIKQS